MRAPRGGGRGRAIASAPANDALAVDGGRVAYAAGAAIWLVDRNPVGDASGDRPPRRLTTAPDPPLGLTLDARAVYWADGHQLLTARLAGGAAAIFASPAPQAASPQRGAVELIVDGDAVYFSSLGDGAAGVFRAPRGGPAHTLAADEPTLGDGLARVGRALYAIVDGSGILRVPMDGGAVDRLVLDDDGTTLVRVVGGGDAVIALRLIGGTAQLEELDPTTGARRPLWTLPSGSEATPNALTADEAAVYTYLSDTAWLIAVPRHGAAGRSAAHEVSAQRPTKAPPTRGPGAPSR